MNRIKEQNIFDLISVDGLSLTPKYIQLANSIQDAVIAGKIQQNRTLPSLHQLTYHLEISRETADRSYRHLRSLGILSSIPGKGHYVTSGTVARLRKVFLMLNTLSAEKKLFYDTFAKALGNNVVIDFYIYNNDPDLFKRLFNRRKDDYSHYVILPGFDDEGSRVHELINTLPKNKLIILDKTVDGLTGTYGAVLDNFSRNIYRAFESMLEILSKYHTIRMVAQQDVAVSPGLIKGTNLFCQQYAFDRSVEYNVDRLELKKGEIYFCLDDEDLVTLIDRALEQQLEVGKDIGILSYNETPLKKYILNGITTISTDFEQMGMLAAKMVLSGQMEQVELDCHLKLRNSL